jgi:hypothetical protein
VTPSISLSGVSRRFHDAEDTAAGQGTVSAAARSRKNAPRRYLVAPHRGRRSVTHVSLIYRHGLFSAQPALPPRKARQLSLRVTAGLFPFILAFVALIVAVFLTSAR